MTTFVCVTCGTQYAPSGHPPDACPICDDPRQYVPEDGQRWIAWDAFLAGHRAEIRDDAGYLGIGSTPELGIGQRALLVGGGAGNVLWDCTTYIDDDVIERVGAAGGLAAIAISHPHFYSAMVEWAHAFDCPIFLHADDRGHVLRPDDSLRFWEGETHQLGGGLTLVRCGGHFDGSQVLHDAGRRALLVGDTVQVIPDRTHVSFMRSYPNLIPLPASKVRAIGAALEPFAFDTIHGAWFGRVVPRDGSSVVRRSVDRYLLAIAEPALPAP